MTRFAVAVFAVLLAAVPVRSFDSHCGIGTGECPNGLAAARARWGVAANASTVDPRAEHARLWLETLAASGLPASLNEDIELPVFAGDAEVLGLPTVRPVRSGAVRKQLRLTSLAELTQLPDFSFTLWDWATGNEGCPPGPLNADVCHRYFPHIGMLNSNHMVPQARRFYEHYHRLAEQRAAQCAIVFDDLPAAHRERFRPYVLACEKLALALEAVGQHFLQDAWSMGHMWERWGGPEFGDFGSGPLGDRTLGAAIAAYTGIVHGARSMLGPSFDDPLCAPHPGVTYIDGAFGAVERLGLGDVFLNDVLLPAPDASDYGPQRRAVFGCAIDGMRAVYQQTAQAHGTLGAASAGAFDPARSVDDDSCWGQRATNQALAIGFGLHTGTQPNQQPLLEVYPGLADAGQENETFPAGILAFAFATFAPAAGLPPMSAAQAERFATDAAAAATEAAAKGVDPATALSTDLAAGGLLPIVGIGPNSRFARGGPSELPASYSDPFLPWNLFETDAVLAERKTALNLTFADAHAADRCGELAEPDLLEYRALAEAAVAGGDPAVEDARCGQCEQMVMPHLRFGQSGNHDTRREAFCAFVGPPDSAFAFTGEDPATFTGQEDTSFDALRVATRKFCGCSAVVMTVTFPATIAEGAAETLRVELAEEDSLGSQPLEGATIELLVTGGTAAATTGTTDVLGEFATTASLAPSSTSITIEVIARDAPGGFVLARKTVSAALAIEEFVGLWRGRVKLTVVGVPRPERCGTLSVTALESGGFRLFLCSDAFGGCGPSNMDFSNCATVFEVNGSGGGFTGLMTDHTGACCRGCPGQNRQWELGCQISGSVVAGTDGQPHLMASIDTLIDACSPGGNFATTLDLIPFGAAPGCGDCIVSGGEECEPPGTDDCQADCRRPPPDPDD